MSCNSSSKPGYVNNTNINNNNGNLQQKRNSSDNNRQQININKLSQVRILQKHILYVIGISPHIAKEEILRKYEFFGQYGRIQLITINKDKAFQSENQGTCYSVYITYSTPQEASIAILAVDQHAYDNRLIRASFGRTKYCKFFLKDTQCLNKDCPYMHELCNGTEVLTKDDMAKKALFQQCQQLAFQLSKICEMDENECRHILKSFKDQYYPGQQHRPVMPAPESIFDKKKQLFKLYAQYTNSNPTRKVRKMTMGPTQEHPQQQQILPKYEVVNKERTMSYTQKDPQSQQKMTPQPKSKDATQQQEELKKLHHQGYQNVETVPQYRIKMNSSTNLQVQKLGNKRRTNSSDERNQQTPTTLDHKKSNNRIQDFELQLANSLKKHLGPSNTNDNDYAEEGDENQQSISLFNEKKTSRFLSLKEDEAEEQEVYRENHLLARRPSLHQKKGSMQSLIVESLKFLNDDTDVVPNKREPLLQQTYTNPPSEVFNIAHESTPAPSHLGGCLEDDQFWNNTIFSNHEHQMYQQTVGTFDDKSYYSHQVINKSNQFNNDIRNSLYTSFNMNNANQKSNQFNDSIQYQTNSLSNKFFGAMEAAQMGTQNQDYNFIGRRTTFNPNNSSMVGDVLNLQLTRSPSQPNYDNSAFTQGIQKVDNALTQRSNVAMNYACFNEVQYRKNELQNQTKSSQQLQTHMSQQDYMGNRLHSQSYDIKSLTLNKQNLDLFDKQYSRDYAKIFLQDSSQSQNNIISSQSIFCYNSCQLEDEEFTYNKYSERQVPMTPIKGNKMYSIDDEDYYYQDERFPFDKEEDYTKNSEQKNYYQEFLNANKSFFSNHQIRQKRRNSVDHDRDKLQPQQLQFTSPGGFEEGVVKLKPGKKLSNSRSPKRKTASIAVNSNQRD